MKSGYKNLFFLFLYVAFLFILFNINAEIQINNVSALEIKKYPSFLGLSITKSSSFIDYARYFFNAGMAIAGFLAVLVIIFGGVYYLISLGRGKFTDEGKQWLKAGILGLLLLVSAYLIAYTINPALIDFRLQKLFHIGFFNPSGNLDSSGPPRMVYEEIPLGSLTENLLSRTMDCYDYDGDGDPIENYVRTDDNKTVSGPTFLEHDRAECLLKLSQAAEKKAEKIDELSKEIASLMDSCTCGTDSPPKLPSTWYTVYGHMDKTYVSLGQRVWQGDIIGEVGSTGSTPPFPHLHFAVGFATPRASSVYNVATSFNIYSKISAPGGTTGSRTFGTFALPLPDNVTERDISRVLNSLTSPVDINHCNWYELMGSYLHSEHAYWAQDWLCATENLTESANVKVMSGGTNIKSIVSYLLPLEGGVIIRHTVIPSFTTSNPLVSQTNCKSNCGKNGIDCLYSEGGACPRDEGDIGSTAPCKDTCSESAGCSCQGTNCQTCPEGVKDKIEYGPIQISSCTEENIKEYKGLEEFRTQFSNDYNLIKNIVETSPPSKVNEKEITTIEKESWLNLRLIDQLAYLKGKMEEIKSSIEKDLDELNSARKKIADCYTIKSSVDLLGIMEETKKEEKIIFKTSSFKDVMTGKVIDSSKYCKGFDFADSNCYSKCQNICPETLEDLTCYEKCENCDEKNPEERALCLKNQEKCVKKCYNNRECPQNLSDLKTFPECIAKCKQQCHEFCDIKYASCPNEINKCRWECNNDSMCLLENEENCTVNFLQLRECIEIYKKPDNLKSCMNNSFLCKYCSDQYATYPECAKDQKQYSSSYLFQNPEEQKCRYPYKPYTSGVNVGQTCLSLYPETAKCPSVSMCPKCPCGTISETINYYSDGSSGGSSNGSENNSECACHGGVPGTPSCYPPCSDGENDDYSSSGESSTKILGYQACSGNCNEFTYIGDPLTFYCRTSWEPEAPISGKWLDYSKANEIPVGQTVDDAKKWANEFIKKIDDFTKKTNEMIQYVNSIGQETNYCQCDSKCDDTGKEPTCNARCVFQQTEATTITTTLEDGTEYDTEVPEHCSCAREICNGNPCQKMINLLLGKSANEKCPEGTEFKGVGWYYNQINSSVKELEIFIKIERADILKKLSYSRKKMDECSQQAVKLGTDVIMTFNCTKAYRGILALPERCYGIYDGQLKTPQEDKTDNWFCFNALLK